MPIHRRDKEPLEFKEKVELRSDVKVLVMNEGDEVTL